MEVEQKMVSFPIDEKLQENVQKLVAEGWQLNPSAPPTAVYHLMRPKAEPVMEHGSLGRLLINDDLITVLKAPTK